MPGYMTGGRDFIQIYAIQPSSRVISFPEVSSTRSPLIYYLSNFRTALAGRAICRLADGKGREATCRKNYVSSTRYAHMSSLTTREQMRNYADLTTHLHNH